MKVMKFISKIMFFLSVFAFSAHAETLDEALALAYLNNPDLRAARANLRVVDEGVPAAKSSWRATISSSLKLGTSFADSTFASGRSSSGASIPSTANVTLIQPIYRSGKSILDGDALAAIKQAKSNVQAERSRMFAIEQNIMLGAATAYVDVVRAGSVVKLQINNLSRLRKQLTATRDRFAVGEVTRTDVAQAESRVARAEADRIQAVGNLTSARMIYQKIIGGMPGNLKQPRTKLDLPASLEDTVAIAMANNFSLITKQFEERSANLAVKLVTGKLLPTINIVSTLSRSDSSGETDSESTSLLVEAQLSFPIYQAGAVSSNIRQAKEEANRRRILLESARREVIDKSARSFEAWTTAVARKESLGAEVLSAEIALEGVTQEATVGARTVLDVLDAEQELLNAQVALVRAERDAFVASYQLLEALGRLTAKGLSLPVEFYDYDRHFVEVEDMAYGTETPGLRP